ncbi:MULTISPECIES: hypothetical protein [unclassified Oceanispirochaeta]|uniref:hypothetical protein n=1 Tax=unclassified Oceanispirochaeta TaxID=2635722 RepID=UPI000E091EC8|nr:MULTISPECIES: hypothetical protein [unclassified Oceanispirochaeta]MBF9018843.1 hypothetical protein [Oceanispirochaeta sp. M2]NPD75331.1 hypothetical protein [Oceanispirochaeta sp. M1]RDG28823.1 hypothetical protein DV872_24870 [Oceanispirochaeta sp. M1]
MENKQIIPTLAKERRLFIKEMISNCSDPCLYENVENPIYIFKRNSWIHKKRSHYSEYSISEKRNVLFVKIDNITHFVNVFTSYLLNPKDTFFSRTYDLFNGNDTKHEKGETQEVWADFILVLTFIEPLLPINRKLKSVIDEGPHIFNENYSGFSAKVEDMTIDDYKLYFRNLVLPAYTNLWKEALSLDQKDEINNMEMNQEYKNQQSAPDHALSSIFKDWPNLKINLKKRGTLSEISGGRGYIFNDNNHGDFLTMLRENAKTMTSEELSRARTIIENNIFPGNEVNRFVKKTISNNF